jgi:hypothetical protein
MSDNVFLGRKVRLAWFLQAIFGDEGGFTIKGMYGYGQAGSDQILDACDFFGFFLYLVFFSQPLFSCLVASRYTLHIRRGTVAMQRRVASYGRRIWRWRMGKNHLRPRFGGHTFPFPHMSGRSPTI